MIYILDQSNTGVRHHLGHGQFAAYHLPNLLLVYQTHELTRAPQPGPNIDNSSAKCVDPLKPLSLTEWPSQ